MWNKSDSCWVMHYACTNNFTDRGTGGMVSSEGCNVAFRMHFGSSLPRTRPSLHVSIPPTIFLPPPPQTQENFL